MPDPLPWDNFDNRHVLTRDRSTPVHVLGAGLAGCWMARTLAEAGIKVIVLEAGPQAASAASSNPAGIVKPFVTRGPGKVMSFYSQAYSYLQEKLDHWGLSKDCQYSPCGVVQLVDKPYPATSQYANLSTEQVERELELACDSRGILFENAGWLNPAALCDSLLKHSLITLRTNYRVQSIKPLEDTSWELYSAENAPIYAAFLVLTTGTSLNMLAQTRMLAITPARGQISRFTLKAGASALARVVNAGHYIIPDGTSVITGATFEREVSDENVRAEDNIHNYNALQKTLRSLDVIPQASDAFAGVRATTADRMPLIGPLPDMQRLPLVYADLHHGRPTHSYPALPLLANAFVLGGLGSRGIVTSPFAASLLTDYMLGGDDIKQWSAIINPARFQIRALRKR